MPHTSVRSWTRVALACLFVVAAGPQTFAQDKPMDQQAMMAAMEKARTPGEHHKMLASLAGDWTFVNRMWMDPSAPPMESTGTASYATILGGRYIQGTYAGQMMGMPFEGIGVTGFDNVTRRFQSSWIDNFGTMLMYMTGTYDPATKAITFLADVPDAMAGGALVKVREVIVLVDHDTHRMEWYETRGGKESKTMEITYKRKK